MFPNATASTVLTESGTYLTSSTGYTLTDIGTDTTNSLEVSNNDSGTDSLSTTTAGSSTLTAIGSNSAGNYTQTTRTTDSTTWQESGNDYSGAYSGSGSDSSTITIQENTSNSGGFASYTEVSVVNGTTQESGNRLSGDYSRDTTNSTTVTLLDSGSDTQGSFTIAQSDSGTTTRHESGNYISGDYSASGSTTDSYSLSETVQGATSIGFTLLETGTASTTLSDSGNTLLSSYTTTVSGSDTYSLGETGTNSSGTFSETVTGSDTVSWTETGNSAQQTFSKSEAGSGTYTRSDSGPGATLTGGSGSYSYSLQEGGSWRAGSVTQTETGTDRYKLLQNFDNVATASNAVPGHLDFSPFGATFTDPIPSTTEEMAAWAGAFLGAGGGMIRSTFRGPFDRQYANKVTREAQDQSIAQMRRAFSTPPEATTLWRRNVGSVPVLGYADRHLNPVEPIYDWWGQPSSAQLLRPITRPPREITDARTHADLPRSSDHRNDGRRGAGMAADLVRRMPGFVLGTAVVVGTETVGGPENLVFKGLLRMAGWTFGKVRGGAMKIVQHGNPSVVWNDGAAAKKLYDRANVILRDVAASAHSVRQPVVQDAALKRIVSSLYQQGANQNIVGTGSAADALRAERRMGPGAKLLGAGHEIKVNEAITRLEKWKTANPGHAETTIADSLLKDLRDALTWGYVP